MLKQNKKRSSDSRPVLCTIVRFQSNLNEKIFFFEIVYLHLPYRARYSPGLHAIFAFYRSDRLHFLFCWMLFCSCPFLVYCVCFCVCEQNTGGKKTRYDEFTSLCMSLCASDSILEMMIFLNNNFSFIHWWIFFRYMALPIGSTLQCSDYNVLTTMY